MNDKNWTTEQPEHREPWDDGFYRTGSTRPPKRYGGLIAGLLVAVIFLCGIAGALGLLNIRLFRQIQNQPDDQSPVIFSQSGDVTQEPSVATAPTQTAPTGAPDMTLELIQTPDSVENVPQEGGLSLQQIYEKNIVSVVSIVCTTDSGSASGTGVILSENGYIVTNCHVVEGATDINVLLTNEEVYSAAVIGVDAVSDLAVLYIRASGLTPAVFGSSDSLRVGDAVAAIGDPLGVTLRGTMTDGIVSAINRDITANGRTMTLIQTNAALNSGNSGGPLLNCYGQVIGINTMKIGSTMSSSGVEGLGFAIPSTTVQQIVNQLIRQGYVSGRPSLGITGEALSSFDQLMYRLPQGIYITEVDPDSAAAAKGISPGDVLISLDGVRVTDSDTLNSQLYSHQAGDTVSVVIYRSGKQYALELTIGEAN